MKSFTLLLPSLLFSLGSLGAFGALTACSGRLDVGTDAPTEAGAPPAAEPVDPATGTDGAAPAQCPANTVDPSTWFLSGRTPKKYAVGSDSSVTCNGSASLSLASTSPASDTDFGTAMTDDHATMAVPNQFLGKRVRLSGFVRSDKVTGWAGLWMRVDGSGAFAADGPPAPLLAFDNMAKRPIAGSTNWTKYEVVLDVAESAENLAYGILLNGEGSVWLDGVDLEVVDTTVPTTGR